MDATRNTLPQTSTKHLNPPDVSVIVPVYNCDRYIWDTLDSVFAQELHPSQIELIAIDDGSTDASLAILRSIESRHSNMTVLSIPNSGSASAPRNAGLEIAKGRYVFFLDADDRLEPDALKRALEVADTTGSGVVLLKMAAEGDGTRGVPVPTRAFRKDHFSEDFIDSKAFTTLGPTKLFKRSIIEENSIRFPTGYLVGEDQPFVMAAFLNSPHISTISDKVYYWVQERGDGTNATSQAQPPHKQLLKNLNLIDTIMTSDEPIERLQTLLDRPVIGSGGLRLAFGKRFATSYDEEARTLAVNQARTRLLPIWTERLRAQASLEPQILLDLVVRGDVAAVTQASHSITETGKLPLEFDYDNREFVYRPLSGAPIRDLNIDLVTHLSTAHFSLQGIEVSGEAGIAHADTAPNQVTLIWKHRSSGEERSFPMQIDGDQPIGQSSSVQFSGVSKISELVKRGPWDAFIEASWPDFQVRARWGRNRDESIDTTPTLFGHPPIAAMIYTKYGNLTVDVGPTEKYSLETSNSAEPAVVGQFTVARSNVMIVQGNISNVKDVLISNPNGMFEKKADFHLLNDHSLAIVVPSKRPALHGPEIFLVSAAGDRVGVAWPKADL